MATETNKELFVGGFAKILKEQRQVDVRLKAGDSGDEGASTSAHKLVLSARSEVFKKMLESDEIKASAQLETITLCEMKHEELEAFIEFIYSDGSMLSAKEKQHKMANKIEFIDSFAKYWKEKVGVDVLLKAGDQTDPIPAHKIILAASSEVLKQMIDSTSSASDPITFSEMTHDELYIPLLSSCTKVTFRIQNC
ncbi:BTB/POZ domain [Arabidopsis thaliana x Arabidopsis arenosa]|nr:hypothetical protein [Arabidopsis thaliana]AAM15350.1 hypothetical protein [Arabidopsis thaliana]KAG7639196.1 BTB/POZ domain [Arabidopsis thaliana x Arabidopsis arenosa]